MEIGLGRMESPHSQIARVFPRSFNVIPNRESESFAYICISFLTRPERTIHSVARACLAQFDGVEADEHNWTLVRTPGQVEKILGNIAENPGIVMFTLVSDVLRRTLQDGCRDLQIPCIPVLDPVLAALGSHLGIQSRGQPGRQHELDSEYFERIDAMTFALNHDDGQAVWNLHNADVILLGVSRTSKTPTCIYLANRGVKAANIPIVPGVPLPQDVFELGAVGPLVVGLTKEVESLVQIRRNRLRLLSEDHETDYIDPENGSRGSRHGTASMR